MRLLPPLLLAIAIVSSARTPADACSAPACWPGSMTPRDATPVPANLPGIYWRPLDSNSGDDPADSTKVVLATAAAPSTPLPFTTTALADGAFLIVPTDPLIENTTYLVTDGNTCESFGTTGPTTSFQVAAAAQLPIALGSLSVVSDTVEMMTAAEMVKPRNQVQS